MTTIVAIRTHKWDQDAERLFGQLQPVFGDNLVVAFHNRPAGLDLPLRAVDLNDAWLSANALRRVHDWGWRCGDYFLYAVRQAFPDADYIWLIEPDVYFTADPALFFAGAAQSRADLLGVNIRPMDKGHRFGRGMPDLPQYQSLFALSRFSGRAADKLFRLRQDYAQQGFGTRLYTNDEVFCYSNGMADPELLCESLADLLPDWIGIGRMAGDPDRLVDSLAPHQGPGVFHPVRGRDSFGPALAGRLVAGMGFVRHMGPSLAALGPQARAAIAEEVARRTLELLDAVATLPDAETSEQP